MFYVYIDQRKFTYHDAAIAKQAYDCFRECFPKAKVSLVTGVPSEVDEVSY